MAIKRWEPFGELTNFRREMDRLWDSFWGKEPMTVFKDKWTPAVDVIESDNEIIVKAELPGIDEKDISLSLSGDNLLIKGEKKAEKEEKGKHFHRIERSYGNYERTLPLPVSIIKEKIKAEYKKGILTIHLPKKPDSKPKEIPITVE